MNIFRTLIIGLFVALSGCATLPDNHIDGNALPAKSGILVVGLHTDAPVPTNPLTDLVALFFVGEGDSEYVNRHIVFQGGNYYAVIPLPARKYHFDLQSYGKRFWALDKSAGFTIRPDTITYIGDITSTVIDSYDLGVKDEFANAKNYLRSKYPKMLTSYSIEKQITPVQFEPR